MLNALFRILRWDITGGTWQEESTHSYFGNIVLFAFKSSDDSYWEAELEIEGQRIFVGINVPKREAPTTKHVEFAERIISQPDATFTLVAPLLKAEFETIYNQPFPDNWREAVKLVGFTIPEDANDSKEWEIHYESTLDSRWIQFECNIFDGKVLYVVSDS